MSVVRCVCEAFLRMKNDCLLHVYVCVCTYSMCACMCVCVVWCVCGVIKVHLILIIFHYSLSCHLLSALVRWL